jgi:preprotein translocase subunit SecE
MNKIKLYIKESTHELLHKVSWPTWAELQNSAVIVMVASLIIALLIYIMDAASGSLMGLLYNL